VRVFRLTQIGFALASHPSGDTSDERKILAWLRRRGYSGTDEQIKDLFGGDAMRARIAINNLSMGDSPRIIQVGSR
jgi:hypothetical protein